MIDYLQYIILFVVLFAAELLYFRIARKFNIIDKPNERSSHNYITIRGGGVVFWLAAVLLITNYELRVTSYFWLFIIGITLISIVSFWDDNKPLPPSVRSAVQIFTVAFTFLPMLNLENYSFLSGVLIVAVAMILIIGILNAYNFMDGINGITGLYSLVILIALQVVNYYFINFTTPEFINYAIIACVVFLFFNFRKRARCFAGDVGSMAIAFWIVTLLLQIIIKTNSIFWLMLLAVYGVDSVCTIICRLYKKENIFKPHRSHVYQLLANEMKIPHTAVSGIYAGLQLVINAGFILIVKNSSQFLLFYFVTVITLLSIVYITVVKK